MKWISKSAIELAQSLKSRQVTCRTVIDELLSHIRVTDPSVKAFIHLHPESAYEEADRIDRMMDEGKNLPPLAGVPIAIKNNICVKGTPTTCASKILENYVSCYSATVIEKLKENYLIPIGSTNLDEFAMGSSTENSAFFPTNNPWNLDHVPGGSSGGSAAAVAACEAPLALGSDTGGSIRQPASFCGVVGIKPTYGRVSRYGLVAFASSLDQIGPITRTVADAAALLNVISGFDPHDATSSRQPVPDFTKALGSDIRPLKIGVPTELFNAQLDASVYEAISSALDILRPEVAQINQIQLTSFQYALPSYYIIAPAEASANLARFDGVRFGYRTPNAPNLREMYKKSRGEGFGSEVKRRIILGTFVLSSGYYDAYYLKAQKVRTLIQQDFANAFSQYDVIITPTSPTPAFKQGDCTDDPLKMYLADIATIPANLAGLPAISIPCGFSKEGLPIGIQIIGKPFDEATVLRVASRFEQLTPYHTQLPKLANG